MSVYTYPESKVIDSITFRHTEKGTQRAYLHARPDVDAATTHQIVTALQGEGFDCIPYNLDGKPTLEVRGFKNQERLLDVLGQWVSGNPKIVKEESDNITFWDKLKKRTLQLSGVSYLIGDWGFWTYNRKEADGLGMAGAFSYFLGTLALVFYGRNDQSDLQVKKFSKDLKRFLNAEQIQPSPGSALHEVSKDHDKPLLQSLNEFGKRYPSEMFNSVTALAGVFVAASAYRKVLGASKLVDLKARRELTHEGWMDVGLGVTTAVSGTLATLVKEKKPDPDDPPVHGLKWVWQQIQAHPLAIAGGGYTIATMCHAASTYKAYKEAKRVNDLKRLESVPRRALFVGMALLSEFLLAISSKGHGQGVVSDNSVNNSAIALTADMIAMQPREKQEHLIDSLAAYLSSPEVLAMKNQDVRKQLQDQVEVLRKNPWAMCGVKQDAAQDGQKSPVPDTFTELKMDGAKKEMPTGWAAKHTLEKTQTPQPSISA